MKNSCQSRYNYTCHIRVAVEEWLPWISVVTTTESDSINIEGPMKILLDNISNTLNVTYSLSLSKERVFGSMRTEGNWSGIIGMLAREESDVAAGPLTQTFRRMKTVGFSDAIELETYRLLLWQKGRSAGAQYSYLLVVSATVWVMLLLSLCVFSFVETVHIWARTKKSFREAVATYFNEVWKFFSLEIRQSVSTLKMDNRFLLAIWLLSSTVMSSTFGCNLVSLLLRENNAHSISQLTDLLKYPEVDLVVSKDSSFQQWLKDHQDSDIRQLYESMTKKENCFVSLRDFNSGSLLDRVQNKSAVVFSDQYTVAIMLQSRTISKSTCRFHTVGLRGSPKPLAMAWRKTLDHRLKEDINYKAHRFVESAILRQWILNNTPKAASCLVEEVKREGKDPLLFRDIKGILYTWLGGVFVSILGFFGERCIWKIRQARGKEYHLQ